MTVLASVDDIGPTIRELRKARGWSTAQLAAEAGVSHSSISLIECGHRIPHTPKLIAILYALGRELVVAIPAADVDAQAALAAALLES